MAATKTSTPPSIRLRASMSPLFGILTNANHGWITQNREFVPGHSKPTAYGESRSFGAWADGPMNPYRHGGHTYFQIPHSENYRVKVSNNYWGDPKTWTMDGDGMPSPRRAEEYFYDNRHWIFSVRNVSGTLYALTHHEWYKDRITIGNVQGFLADGKPWICSIGWAKSTNGGLTWQMMPITDGSRRLVLVPEPSNLAPAGEGWYGFAHPSNLVWDAKSQRFYAFASSVNRGPNGQRAGGVALFRTGSLEKPTGWEFWNGGGWTLVDHNTYQGNFGPQMPYLFWRREGSGFECSHVYAMNVRRHRSSGKWIVLGHEWCTPNAPRWQATFSWTGDIARPTDLDIKQPIATITSPPGVYVTGRPYYSFFDVDGSADDNYQDVGNVPLLVSVAGGDASSNSEAQGRYYHQFIDLSGF